MDDQWYPISNHLIKMKITLINIFSFSYDEDKRFWLRTHHLVTGCEGADLQDLISKTVNDVVEEHITLPKGHSISYDTSLLCKECSVTVDYSLSGL